MKVRAELFLSENMDSLFDENILNQFKKPLLAVLVMELQRE